MQPPKTKLPFNQNKVPAALPLKNARQFPPNPDNAYVKPLAQPGGAQPVAPSQAMSSVKTRMFTHVRIGNLQRKI